MSLKLTSIVSICMSLSGMLACSTSPKVSGVTGGASSGSSGGGGSDATADSGSSSTPGKAGSSGSSSSGAGGSTAAGGSSAAGGSTASSGAGGSAAGAVSVDPSLAQLSVLTPAQLGQKIYAALGPNMTLQKVAASGKTPASTTDYLQANASNFVGQIGSDPSDKFASGVSIGYFMALAGLANVVGTNYKAALAATPPPANDCRQTAGAQAILQAIAPTISASDLSTIGATLVATCTADPVSAISAVVQSYSMALSN